MRCGCTSLKGRGSGSNRYRLAPLHANRTTAVIAVRSTRAIPDVTGSAAPAHPPAMTTAPNTKTRATRPERGQPSRRRHPRAYVCAVCDSNSYPTKGSSPTTHASWPGAMKYASPGPISASVPSSCTTCMRPAITAPTCLAWQLSVPATGLMHSDQRQPGCAVSRAAYTSPSFTTLSCVLSGVRLSSGASKLFLIIASAHRLDHLTTEAKPLRGTARIVAGRCFAFGNRSGTRSVAWLLAVG
jgi:hypothetical protein